MILFGLVRLVRIKAQARLVKVKTMDSEMILNVQFRYRDASEGSIYDQKQIYGVCPNTMEEV